MELSVDGPSGAGGGVRIEKDTTLASVRSTFPIPPAYVFGVPPSLEDGLAAEQFLPLVLLKKDECAVPESELLGGRECARLQLQVDQLASTVASHEAHAAEQRGAAARLIQEVRTVEAQCAKFEAALGEAEARNATLSGRLAAAEARAETSGAAAEDATAARTALAAASRRAEAAEAAAEAARADAVAAEAARRAGADALEHMRRERDALAAAAAVAPPPASAALGGELASTRAAAAALAAGFRSLRDETRSELRRVEAEHAAAIRELAGRQRAALDALSARAAAAEAAAADGASRAAAAEGARTALHERLRRAEAQLAQGIASGGGSGFTEWVQLSRSVGALASAGREWFATPNDSRSPRMPSSIRSQRWKRSPRAAAAPPPAPRAPPPTPPPRPPRCAERATRSRSPRCPRGTPPPRPPAAPRLRPPAA